MLLNLPKRDIHHALSLFWEMTRRHPEWKQASYELRAQLRECHGKLVTRVNTQIERRGDGVGAFDLSPDLVAFAKQRIIWQLISSYFWAIALVGWAFGILGVVAVECVAERFLSNAASAGAPLNPATVLAYAMPVMSLFPAALIAWLRGAWRSLALVRHARSARLDSSYRLPTPQIF